MIWEKLGQVVEQVEDLKRENEELGKAIEKYSNKFLGVMKENQNASEIHKQVTKLSHELISLKEKASKKVIIEFVGATSSGKSSLINCLLRDDRLPVDDLRSTMNSIHVCTTESSSWSAFVDGKLLDPEETLPNLLNATSDSTAKKKRKELNITKQSVVEVFWPKDQCTRLPHNVVLGDTPGYGESFQSTKVVTDSCRKADIIVTVMNITSPALETVSNFLSRLKVFFPS